MLGQKVLKPVPVGRSHFNNFTDGGKHCNLLLSFFSAHASTNEAED